MLSEGLQQLLAVKHAGPVGWPGLAKGASDGRRSVLTLVWPCLLPLVAEFSEICRAVALGFFMMGFLGYFVKLIHIPMSVFSSPSFGQLSSFPLSERAESKADPLVLISCAATTSSCAPIDLVSTIRSV
jgi:hypothetical protein